MKNILTFGGSNSRKSINKSLAVYAAGLIENAELSIADLNDFELPIYSSDLEAENGIPQNAAKFDKLIQDADGIVLSLAEHNGLPTAAFKNLVDWLSRIDQNVWKKKPMLLMAASPGGRGGANALRVMIELLPHFGGNVVADFSLPSFYKNFTAEGIIDPALSLELQEKVQSFESSLNKFDLENDYFAPTNLIT